MKYKISTDCRWSAKLVNNGNYIFWSELNEFLQDSTFNSYFISDSFKNIWDQSSMVLYLNKDNPGLPIRKWV
jgi:hypothetical protein